MSERLQWFLDRIGKRVYRPATTCKCGICADVVENGLIIADVPHAEYLWDVEGEYQANGIAIKYFDTKEEAEQLKKTEKKEG